MHDPLVSYILDTSPDFLGVDGRDGYNGQHGWKTGTMARYNVGSTATRRVVEVKR